jgi:hypothetical protein
VLARIGGERNAEIIASDRTIGSDIKKAMRLCSVEKWFDAKIIRLSHAQCADGAIKPSKPRKAAPMLCVRAIVPLAVFRGDNA